MHSASEQVRLDATALSICHAQSNFYKTQLSPLNAQIRLVQVAMAAEVAACVATLAYCPTAATRLKQHEARGKQIMTLQDRLRSAQRLSQWKRLRALIQMNQLDPKHGEFKGLIARDDGLLREGSNSPLKLNGQFFLPPMALKPGVEFESLNTYNFSFRALRNILGRRLTKSDFEIHNNQRIHRKIYSSCQTDWSQGVVRLRD